MATRAIVQVAGKAVKVGTTTNWQGCVATFVADEDVRESSRKLYTRTLTQFFKWVEETGRKLSELTKADVLEYKDHLTEEGFSALTVSSYIVAVRKFYQWAEGYKLYPNIAKGVKTPKRKTTDTQKQHLTDTQSAELLAHFESISLRDYAIVNLMLRTGLRTIEVVRANVGDISFRGEQRVLEVWGKGADGKDDYVALTDKAYLPIANYLATRKGAKAGEPLFASNSRQNKGERLTTRTISHLCKEGLKAIGLDNHKFTAHSLRHTAACAMLQHGAQLMAVQYAMRHASPNTTEIYLKSLDREAKIKDSYNLLDEAF